ncbi:MAG: hypothetical protein ACYCST_09580 [Acidimicrobiales bacterium]
MFTSIGTETIRTPALIGDVDLAKLRRTDRVVGHIHEQRMVALSGQTGFSAPAPE